MKEIFVAIFVFLVLLNNSSKAQLDIGKIENGNTVLTYDKSKLLSAYNANLLKASGIEGNFTDVSIEYTEPEG